MHQRVPGIYVEVILILTQIPVKYFHEDIIGEHVDCHPYIRSGPSAVGRMLCIEETYYGEGL
jgi:hypothetical protein